MTGDDPARADRTRLDAGTQETLATTVPSGRYPLTRPDSALSSRSLSGPSQTGIISDRYLFPPHLTGKGECIAILAFGGRPRPSDLIRFFEQETGVVPDLRFRNATSTDSPNQNSRHDMETALDIQVAGALAPGARIVTYFSSNDEKGWVDVVSQAIHDRENRPSVISISWGVTEDWWRLEAIQTLNKLFEAASRLGITVCAASGDDGCATDVDGHCRVVFPASSPFVLACGGTHFAPDGVEIVWNEGSGCASGGGISDRISRPSWQPRITEVPSSHLPSRRDPSFDGRQLPDVSGLAGHSFNVYAGGIYRNFVGGTSAVAPLWSALIARMNEGLRNRGFPPVGHFHPRLYREQVIQNSFRSVTSGHNDPFVRKGYVAHQGWNFCAGWGSPDGMKLLEALCS